MERIRNRIASKLDSFTGDFVVPKNAYERRFCDLLGWETFDGRYYDAFDGETFIEIKKGQGGMHFRYGAVRRDSVGIWYTEYCHCVFQVEQSQEVCTRSHGNRHEGHNILFEDR